MGLCSILFVSDKQASHVYKSLVLTVQEWNKICFEDAMYGGVLYKTIAFTHNYLNIHEKIVHLHPSDEHYKSQIQIHLQIKINFFVWAQQSDGSECAILMVTRFYWNLCCDLLQWI